MRALLFLLSLTQIPSILCGCQSPPTPPAAIAPPPSADQALPAPGSDAYLSGEVFDQVWVIIRDTHPDPTINHGEWNEKRLQFRERAVAATDPDEFRSVVRDMLETLGESHFAIIPNSVTGTSTAVGGWSGLTLQVLDGAAIVTAVAPDSPCAKAGVATGWRLIESQGDSMEVIIKPFGTPRTSLERLARDQAVEGFIGGRPGMSPDYRFVDANGAEHKVSIMLEDLPGESVKMGNLPPFPARVDWRWLTPQEIAQLGGDPALTGRVGYLHFSVWLAPLSKRIDAALATFRTADAIVMDLRGNPGGLGLMATGVAGHFLPRPTSLGTMRGRDMALDFKTNPRTVDADGNWIGTFDGPLAILMDGHTGSTSEIFAAGLVDLKRAECFGQTSAGAALPATTHNLKNGDVLLHAIGDFRTPSGALVEGSGVAQQIGNAPTRTDYTSSPNPELRDALLWIAIDRVSRSAKEQQ